MFVLVSTPPRCPWLAETVLVFVASARHLSRAWTVPADFSHRFSMTLRLPVAVDSPQRLSREPKVRILRFFLL
jgi:hypothetical protein